ncbi:MAG TPA: carboxypeptidase-like regulatory domain-containing protein [Bacteroidales bacterium]|nr:carboxypeptidase-like regulatory domain-containing protein [Bacteroidales bacterium]HPT11465.1 carboxypeptidase-like regulatory domain-containing protein [Bacteroidales bacterium]
MKNNKLYLKIVFMMILGLIINGEIFASGNHVRDRKSQQDYIAIKGKVVDMETGSPLIFAGVAVKESNIATVTNVDGEFLIKVPQDENIVIVFSFLGYKNKEVPVSSMHQNGQKNSIALESATIPIKEVVVKPLDPDYIMREVLRNFGKNYPEVANDMSGFYRETIRKNRSYVSIGEAVVDIFKAPYSSMKYDAAKIYKGRKNTDSSKLDTVLFRLQGGPVTALDLDLVKNPETILTSESLGQYDFSVTGVVVIDDKPNYIITFVQKPEISIPLFTGKLYIDINSYAISEAEFGVNMTDKAAVTSMFVRKKPIGMSVTPEVTEYLVRYKESKGKWYFAYSRAEVKFKVDWKKKLFKTSYTTMSEMAITDRTEENVVKIQGKDKLKANEFFTEEVAAFADPDFWGEYNVIEPDQSIEAAIRRLNRKFRISER